MLNDRIALVTGASRGIGKAIADALGQAGATMLGTAASRAGADAIGERFSAAGIKGKGMVLDASDADSVTALINAVVDGFGTPAILVNNADISQDNPLMRVEDDEWDSIIDTNLSSAYRLSKACLRGMMKARIGRIINIASVLGASGSTGQTNYAVAKVGMVGLTKSLAREVGSRGITVNCVVPGFIATDMTRELPDRQRNALLAGIPLGRLGQPEEIAQSVVFLASDPAGYITGETLHVNGGMYMA